jgi:hypothetical protein
LDENNMNVEYVISVAFGFLEKAVWAVASVAFGYMGYKLFMHDKLKGGAEVSLRGQGQAGEKSRLNGVFRMGRGGPGLIFALLGTVSFAVAVFKSIPVSMQETGDRNGTTAETNGMTGRIELPPGTTTTLKNLSGTWTTVFPSSDPQTLNLSGIMQLGPNDMWSFDLHLIPSSIVRFDTNEHTILVITNSTPFRGSKSVSVVLTNKMERIARPSGPGAFQTK